MADGYQLTAALGREIQAMLRWFRRQKRLTYGSMEIAKSQVQDDGGTAFLNQSSFTVPPCGVVSLSGPSAEDPGDRSVGGMLRLAGRFPAFTLLGKMLYVNGRAAVARDNTGRAYSAAVQPRWVAYTETVAGRPPIAGECWGPGIGNTGADGYRVSVGLPGFRALGPLDTERKIALMEAETVGPWWAVASDQPVKEFDAANQETARRIAAHPCARSDGSGVYESLTFNALFPPDTVLRQGDVFLWTSQPRVEGIGAYPIAALALTARPSSQIRFAELDGALESGGQTTAQGGALDPVDAWRIPAGYSIPAGSAVLLARSEEVTGFGNWWNTNWRVIAQQYKTITAVVDVMADVNATDPDDHDILTQKQEIAVEMTKSVEDPQIIWTHEQYEPPP